MKTKECNKKVKNMFPEYREFIQDLRQENPHFSKLFEEHEELDQKIVLLEQNPVHVINNDIEVLKRKKLNIKDKLYAYLKQAEQQSEH
jgi:uncharacterized protein YdcH (DUF465 family)